MSPSTARPSPASGRRAPELTYSPPAVLGGPHVQTLGARLVRAAAPSIPYRRERIRTPDDDFLDLDHHPPGGVRGEAPTVVVLHGLEGCSRSGYAEAIARSLSERGVRAAVLNFRGCSGEPNRRPRFYHSGETRDLALVLGHLSDASDAPLGAVGFSLGGNVLLKYLAEARPDDPLPDAAAAISVPYDLGAAADHMARGAGRLYSSFFLRSLKEKVRRKARLFPEAYDLDAARAAVTLRDFDDAVTAPVHGFRDAEAYYRRSSCGPHLTDVRVPTLLIHSRDDPFVPPSSLPDLHALAREGPITAAVSPRGGHVGFLTTSSGGLATWAETRAAEYLARRLG